MFCIHDWQYFRSYKRCRKCGKVKSKGVVNVIGSITNMTGGTITMNGDGVDDRSQRKGKKKSGR